MLALGAPSAWGLTYSEVEAAIDILKEDESVLSEQAKLHLQDLEDMSLAHEITRTCINGYTMTASGLAPEIFRFTETEMQVGRFIGFLVWTPLSIIDFVLLCTGR